MKTKTFILLCAVITMASCQKTANTQNSSSSGSGGTGLVSFFTASNPDSNPNASGVFYCYRNSNGYAIKSDAKAMFWDAPHPHNAPFISAGTVYFNSINIPNTGSYSIGTPNIQDITTVNWSISGNTTTGVPAINYTPKIMPQLDTNFNMTAVQKSQGCTISHSSIMADTIYYGLVPQASGATGIYKRMTGTSTGITFTAGELSLLNISSSQKVGLTIYARSHSAYSVSSKQYVFINENRCFKSATITN